MMRWFRSFMPWLAACLCAASLTGALACAAQAARPLALGFDDPLFTAAEPVGGPWLQRAAQSGAGYVRVSMYWASIAPRRPARPSDPADPAYRWSALDEAVRDALAHGLQPLVTINDAPAWAEGAGRPRGVSAGAWRPDARAFGQFAHALAERYSGSYPDPAHPGVELPRVRYLEAWNEPNLSIYLAPQWVRGRGGWVAASPGIYRSLLNAFYAGVKSAVPQDVVVSGGTAPFGDPWPGGQRMPPVWFLRGLLCLGGARPALERCPHPAHFDVLDHHPYSIGGPFQHALDSGDVSIADMYKLKAPLLRAERSGRVLPAGPKPLWVTEVSWDTDPPDPHGVPMAQDVRWIPQALYQLWHQDVSLVMWFLIRDQPPIPSYADTYQSGMYLLSGRAKPSQRAFSFPFLLVRQRDGSEIWWTRAPAAGRLLVQRRVKARWQTVSAARARRFEVLQGDVPRRQRGGLWRATLGAQASLVWQD
jgi:hypothetical protein